MSLAYQWQVSTDGGVTYSDIPANTPGVTGETSSSLILTGLTASNNKSKYRVRLSDTDAVTSPTNSKPATITTAPSVSIANLSNVFSSNGSATITVSATSDIGSLSYQWQKSTDGISFINLNDVTGSVSGSNTSSLVLSNLVPAIDNNTKYRVVVGGQCCGTTTLYSNSTISTLTVQSTNQTIRIIAHPTDELIINGLATFTVSATTTSDIGLINTGSVIGYQWQKFINNAWTNILGATKSSLNLSGLVKADANSQYRVVVYDFNGLISSNIAQIFNSSTVPPCYPQCGGQGWGDVHYYIEGPGRSFLARLDDNPPGAKNEHLILYIKNNKTNNEYRLSATLKGWPVVSNPSPLIFDKIYFKTFDGQQNTTKIEELSLGSKKVIENIVSFTTSPLVMPFVWEILNPTNIAEIDNLDITIGGVWYWINKSFIEYKKSNPKFAKLGWPNISGAAVDGIGMVLKPYSIVRSDFEKAASAQAGSAELSKVCETLVNDDGVKNFWQDLTGVLNQIPYDPTTGKWKSQVEKIICITSNPISAIAQNGSATFYCSSNYSTDFVWQKSKDNGVSWTDIISNNDTNFIISGDKNSVQSSLQKYNLTVSNNGELYRALLQNKSITSNSAKLTYTASNLSILTEPVNQNSINLQATFTSYASGTAPIVYQWYKSDNNGEIFDKISGAVSSGISLTNLNMNDDGDLYRVNIKDGAGNSYDSKIAKLTINPVITITNQPTNQTASNEETATFTTSATCNNGDISYIWEMSHDGKQFSPVGGGSPSGVLALSGLKSYNNGDVYRAKIISLLKSNSVYTNNVTLSVPRSLSISSQPTDQLSISGAATFTVNASTTQSSLTRQWQKSTDGVTYTNITQATGSSLVLSNLTLQDDNTKFRVILQDDRDYLVSNTANLDTTPQITITQQPTSYTATNYSVDLTCNATTTGGAIAIQWQQSRGDYEYYTNISGVTATTNRLIQQIAPDENGKKFRAKLDVTGARTVFSDIATITVPQSISINTSNTDVPVSKKVNYPNKDIILSIDASSVKPPLTYQWQKSTPSGSVVAFSFANNDILSNKVQLLLEFDGIINTQNFVDSSQNALSVKAYSNNTETTSANTSLNTIVKKFGSASAKFDTTGKLRITDTNDKLKFQNNFTIECWYYTSLPQDMCLISRRLTTTTSNGQEGWFLTPFRFGARLGSIWKDDLIDDRISIDSIEMNTWTHIAFTRSNNTYRLFRNGLLVGSFYSFLPLDENSGSIHIGDASGESTQLQWIGYIDRLKITNGVARYTSSFDPNASIDSNYTSYGNYGAYTDISGANSNTLNLTNLSDINNGEKYRVILTDQVSQIITEAT